MTNNYCTYVNDFSPILRLASCVVKIVPEFDVTSVALHSTCAVPVMQQFMNTSLYMIVKFGTMVHFGLYHQQLSVVKLSQNYFQFKVCTACYVFEFKTTSYLILCRSVHSIQYSLEMSTL